MPKRGAQFLVGLMSGTSADGIDAVVCRVEELPAGICGEVLSHLHQPFPAPLRRRILEAATAGTVKDLCELNFILGNEFAQAASKVIRKAGLRREEILAIGSHGQTVRHLPKGRTPSTLQIGEPSVIAERTGVLTVADFRVRDMAAGGEGAPLIAFADWSLFTDPKRARIVQNIGGIANLTYLAPAAQLEDVIAFDTGPGNMVIDAVVQTLSHGRLMFDRGGVWAARGTVSAELLTKAMKHRFFRRPPPRTTGREEFGANYTKELLVLGQGMRLKPADMVATVTDLTAMSIAEAYRRFIFPLLTPGQDSEVQIILGGGGAKNATLRGMLKARLPRCRVLRHTDFGIDDSAKEALGFALLAYQTLLGRSGNVPGATGARRPVVLGKIVPGNSYKGLKL